MRIDNFEYVLKLMHTVRQVWRYTLSGEVRYDVLQRHRNVLNIDARTVKNLSCLYRNGQWQCGKLTKTELVLLEKSLSTEKIVADVGRP